MDLYSNFYNLISEFIFNNNVPSASNQELICILVSTIATLFIVALPFTIVLKVIKIIMGR